MKSSIKKKHRKKSKNKAKNKLRQKSYKSLLPPAINFPGTYLAPPLHQSFSTDADVLKTRLDNGDNPNNPERNRKSENSNVKEPVLNNNTVGIDGQSSNPIKEPLNQSTASKVGSYFAKKVTDFAIDKGHKALVEYRNTKNYSVLDFVKPEHVDSLKTSASNIANEIGQSGLPSISSVVNGAVVASQLLYAASQFKNYASQFNPY